MLKKEFRLKKRSEFTELKEKGQLLRSPLFGLVYMKSEETKFGWIVSKKISKKAVERNRVRRLMSEVARKNWVDGYKVLVLTKPEILKKKFEEIEEEWIKLMKLLKK